MSDSEKRVAKLKLVAGLVVGVTFSAIALFTGLGPNFVVAGFIGGFLIPFMQPG